MTKLLPAAEKAVNNCLKLKKNENVFIVTDSDKINIANAFAQAVKKAGGMPDVHYIPEQLRPYKPTTIFKRAIEKADAVIYVLRGIVTEKPFRIFMINEGRKHGRVVKMPDVTEDMVMRLVDIDYASLKDTTEKLAEKIENKTVHITADNGTDISFDLKGRKIISEFGDMAEKWTSENLPCGEVLTCPVEETFNGRLVVDMVDNFPGKAELVFKEGKVVEARGDAIEKVMKEIGNDQNGRMIGEFGIGTNPNAKPGSSFIEFEKAVGTVHFAIGDSEFLGRTQSLFHYTLLLAKPKVTIDGETLIEGGRLMI